jgi:CubicO group peptidase (beta-lactamase class C family)
VLLFPARSAAEQPTKVDPARVDEIFAEWNTPTSPGVAVAVVRDGEVVYKKGFGSANLEHRLPITTTTAFNIGSVSKQFTAFAVLLLAKDGKLSLDDAVRKHVPEVPDFREPLTVRHLIHHTSGLREDWSLLAMSGTRAEDVIRTSDLLRLVSRQKALNFAPRAEYLYCNTGYDLLAEVVKRASGKSLRAFARERIFAPAGMKSSEFCDDHRMLIANRADCYRPRLLRGFELVHFATERAGPSNLFTTVEDLARWAIYSEELAKTNPDLAAGTLRRGKLANGKELPYAAGLQHAEYRGAKVIQHGGTTAGYRAAFQRYPEHRFAVVVLSNLATVAPDDLAHHVVDLYLGDKLGTPQAPKPRAVTTAKKYAPAADELTACEGKYYSEELEVLYTVHVRDGALVVSHPKGDLRLRPLRKDAFESVGSDRVFETLDVTRDAKGNVTGFKLSTPRARNVRFAKVELKPAAP